MRIVIGNVRSKLYDATSHVLNILAKELSVRVPNSWFSPAYQSGAWDGYQRFLVRPANTFPTGLLTRVVNVLDDLDVSYELEDQRSDVSDYVLSPVPQGYKIGDVKEARDYQVETINKVIRNQVHGVPFIRGIINIATNGGKTVIAEGIINEMYPVLRARGDVLLFVTHSKEIARQARRSIISDLRIPVGMIGDGQWEVETVNIAIVTTLYRRMKDKKPEWMELRERVSGFIADECLSPSSRVLLPGLVEMRIDEVCERDDVNEVMSWNVEHQVMEPKRILRKLVTPHNQGFSIVWYHDQYGTLDWLSATPNHKIYVINQGYVMVSELQVGDEVRLANGVGVISKVSPELGGVSEYRYNLEVDDNHNYYANGLLVSNCHHSSSDSWYKVFNELPRALIRIGLTGTIDKSKVIQEMKLYACTGEVVNRVSNDYLIQHGYSAKPKCILFKVTSPELGSLDYTDAYQLGIVESDERNGIIRGICEKETRSGNKVLILIEHLDQGEILEEELEGIGHVYFTNGQLSSEVREELLEKLRHGELDVLISSNILDEGIDISGINAVIYARGMKSMRKILQGIGRGLRVKDDGSVLRFYDFIDDMHTTLLEHSLERYNTLKGEKFDIQLLTMDQYQGMSWDEINKR